MQPAETEPPLDFEEHDGEAGGSCGDTAEPEPAGPGLDMPRLWQSMLGAPDEHGAPPPPLKAALPAQQGAGGAKGTPAMIKAGTKDVSKLRRGPATAGGGAAAPVGAIAG